jgi:YjbR protein
MRGHDFRRIALGMDGALEGAHMGHPDFRAHGRIFATLNAEETFGVVMLTPEQQRTFLLEHPDMFSPGPGAWGRSGSTRVDLDVADEDTIGEAVTLAWQNSAAKAKKPDAEKAKRPAAKKKSRR